MFSMCDYVSCFLTRASSERHNNRLLGRLNLKKLLGPVAIAIVFVPQELHGNHNFFKRQ